MRVAVLALLAAGTTGLWAAAEMRVAMGTRLLESHRAAAITLPPDQSALKLELLCASSAMPRIRCEIWQWSGPLAMPIDRFDVEVPPSAGRSLSRLFTVPIPTAVNTPSQLRVLVLGGETGGGAPQLLGAIDVRRVSLERFRSVIDAVKTSGVELSMAGRGTALRQVLARWEIPFHDLGRDLPAAPRPSGLLLCDSSAPLGPLPSNTIVYLADAAFLPVLTSVAGLTPEPFPSSADLPLDADFGLQFRFLDLLQSALHKIKNRKDPKL